MIIVSNRVNGCKDIFSTKQKRLRRVVSWGWTGIVRCGDDRSAPFLVLRRNVHSCFVHRKLQLQYSDLRALQTPARASLTLQQAAHPLLQHFGLLQAPHLTVAMILTPLEVPRLLHYSCRCTIDEKKSCDYLSIIIYMLAFVK